MKDQFNTEKMVLPPATNADTRPSKAQELLDRTMEQTMALARKKGKLPLEVTVSDAIADKSQSDE